jgi:plastocyanin
VKRILVVPLAVVCVALLVAGCGSSSKKSSSTSSAAPPPTTQPSTAQTPPKSGGSGAGSTVKLMADPGGAIKFDKSTLTAKAGKVTLDMTNPSSLMHAIGVSGNGVDKDGQPVGQGGSSTVTVTLKPGKYQFYCPVDGHRQAGMKGTLTVK